ncbi:MAG: mevalonate kinase family protein [Thermoprotei archaeon]|jgi:mevalonate kinase
MSQASAPGLVYLSGDYTLFRAGTSLATTISKRVVIITEPRSKGENKIKVSTEDGSLSLRYERRRIIVDKGGLLAKRVLRPVIVSALKTMEFLRNSNQLDITIKSDIPVSVFPSTSLSIATVMSVAHSLSGRVDRDFLWKVVFDSERSIRKSPSTFEIILLITGGLAVFKIGEKPIFIKPKENLLFLIALSSKKYSLLSSPEITLRPFLSNVSGYINDITRSMNWISENIYSALDQGNIERIGMLMNLAHSLIRALGATTTKIDELVSAALKSGALGAKVTWVNNGLVVALVRDDVIRNVHKSLERRSNTVFNSSTDYSGAKIES